VRRDDGRAPDKGPCPEVRTNPLQCRISPVQIDALPLGSRSLTR
jgi:hypothetical protein